MKTAEAVIRQPKYNTLTNLTLICDAMEEYANQFRPPIIDEDDYDDDEMDDDDSIFERFDCICGAWEWSTKSNRFIHCADCICGSSEPFN